jgi:transposase
MARQSRSPIEVVRPVPGSEDQLVGRKYLRLIEDQPTRLGELKSHPNRSLFLNHVVVAHLLAFFNPGLRGLRGIEDVFDTPRVRRRLGTPRIPKSTLADAQRLFDAQLLLPLIADLQQRVGVAPHDPRLDEITRKLLAVDGSFFAVAPRIAWALYNKSSLKEGAKREMRPGHVLGHFHFDILHGVPDGATLTDGQTREDQQLRTTLQSGAFYVLDRGYQSYDLLVDILTHESDFVVRLRKTAATTTLESRPLTVADRAAGVVSDTLVRLGETAHARPALPALRRVEVHASHRDGTPLVLILLTNRMDLPAWMIALIYQHRWQIELFFRWLKCVAGFQHFFSESSAGMTLQVYVAIIATLLIAVEVGSRPSRYDYSLMTFVASGLVPLEEALDVLNKRRTERARAAEWQRGYNARRKAEKTTR